MWLFNSSIGRKFVMALTGVALVLFVTFHAAMNSVALLWPAAYNQVCEFLGANWYALVASIGLAALLVIHIIYAVWLTVQNRAARGNDRYAVTTRPAQVEWASKNMLVLGIVIVAFLVVHLIQFWAKMQLQELLHGELSDLPQLEGAPVGPAMGTLFLQMAFSSWWTPVVYIIGFVALWFHMTHGFWSMFHSIGWDNNKWISRLKCIGNVWTSAVIALFVAQVVLFTVQAHNKFFTENEGLQEQYAEWLNQEAEKTYQEFVAGADAATAAERAEMEAMKANFNTVDGALMQQQQQALMERAQEKTMAYVKAEGPAFVKNAQAIQAAYNKYCNKLAQAQNNPMAPSAMGQLQGIAQQVEGMLQEINKQ